MSIPVDDDCPFEIVGPDADDCVWIRAKGREQWSHPLGPSRKVSAALSRWLIESNAGDVATLDGHVPVYGTPAPGATIRGD